MIKTRIAYLMSGSGHLPYLLASLWTLRKHWDGEVIVYAWPVSLKIVQQMAKDSRLNIASVRQRNPKYRKRNAQFLDKIKMMQSMVCEVDAALYLDADTTVHGDLSPIIEAGYEYGFAATQFCHWMTNGTKTKQRIKSLRRVVEFDQTMVERLLKTTQPAVNGGVWACRPDSPVLAEWCEYTWMARYITIADEVSLQCIVKKHNGKQLHVMEDEGKWNHSAVYPVEKIKSEDVRVYHYHGNSCVNPKRTRRGIDLWWPIWKECLSANVGCVWDWKQEIGNEYLNALEREMM